MEDDRTTLKPGEYHPAADSAMSYLKSLPMEELFVWREAFASTAIEGNRLSEVCLGTLNRLLEGEMVSDRYLLGVAWIIKNSKETERELILKGEK